MDRDPKFVAFIERIGSGIRQRRNELNLTLETLALEADLAPSYVSEVERGLRNPSSYTLFRLCTALKFEVADLFKN